MDELVSLDQSARDNALERCRIFQLAEIEAEMEKTDPPPAANS